MQTYNIVITKTLSGDISIKAESLEEAIKQAERIAMTTDIYFTESLVLADDITDYQE